MSSQVQYQCAYCKFFINSYCEDYMEHICFSEKLKNLPTDKNYAIVLSGQHNNVLELVEDPSTTRPAASPTEGSLDDEMLISLVQSKRALWDHRLPVAQRSPAKIRQMWESIAQELEELEIQKQILKSLHEDTTKKPDGIDGFLMLLGEGLRRIPQRNQAKMQIRFLEMLADEEESIE